MRRFIGIKMGQSESYKLELRSLPVGVQQFSYVVGDRFFAEMESPDIRSGEVEVAVTVTRKRRYVRLGVSCDGRRDNRVRPMP